MADFAQWSIACETAYQPAGTFMTAYDTFREDAAGFVLEGNLVAETIRQFMANTMDQVTTTTTELYDALSAKVPEQSRKDRSRWPQSSKGLGGQLRKLAPALRNVGLDVKQPGRDAHTGRTVVVLQHLPKARG
jgi:hypothetical protein